MSELALYLYDNYTKETIYTVDAVINPLGVFVPLTVEKLYKKGKNIKQ